MYHIICCKCVIQERYFRKDTKFLSILRYTQKGNKKTSEKTCRSPKKLLN